MSKLYICSLLALAYAIPRQSSASPPARQQKFVFAHHIVGNTFNFTPHTWAADISLAHNSGIDGFALNIGNQAFEIGQVKSAYDAAHNSNTGFKMFLSLDMSSLPCATSADAQNLVSLVRSQSTHPAQLLFGPKNKPLVSTFAGESCTFSTASPSRGWAQKFVAPLAGNIHFVPSFFVNPATLAVGDTQGNGGFGGVIDGDFNFNSGWPIQVTTRALQSTSNPKALASLINFNASGTSSPLSLNELASSAFKNPASISDAARDALAGVSGAFTSDKQHLDAIQRGGSRKTYMAAVSPWFFTHFGANTFNKNFIYLSDNHLYPKRWETLIANRDQVDLVEICTWNDYGESHYVGPIEGILPTGSHAWVNGNDHTGWLAMTTYYAAGFKTGTLPPVTKDKVIMWARTHPRDARASNDGLGRPTNFELTEDSLWATVFATAPSTVTLTTNGTGASSHTFQVSAGVSHLKAPLTVGGNMRAVISRHGQTVVNFTPRGYRFNPNPTTFNFNVFVAASG